jgi:hypothetical protein
LLEPTRLSKDNFFVSSNEIFGEIPAFAGRQAEGVLMIAIRNKKSA